MNTEDKDFKVAEAQFSLYAGGISRKENQTPYIKRATLKDVYAWMNSKRMIDLTHELRAISDEKLQKKFKAERLPFATFSGVFNYRKTDGLVGHSNLLCFDFDHLGGSDELMRVKEVLLKDPYFTTELMFTSPRGDGLKWITHIDIARYSHVEWYRAISNYLKQTYSLVTDSAPSNVASACFLCFDANMFVNDDIAPF